MSRVTISDILVCIANSGLMLLLWRIVNSLTGGAMCDLSAELILEDRPFHRRQLKHSLPIIHMHHRYTYRRASYTCTAMHYTHVLPCISRTHTHLVHHCHSYWNRHFHTLVQIRIFTISAHPFHRQSRFNLESRQQPRMGTKGLFSGVQVSS